MPITISGDSPNFTSVAATTVNGVTTLNSSSGVLATQNGMTGIAKAWVTYNGVSQTILSSFNVSSVTYTGAGDYTVNFTTAMANANYASCITSSTTASTSVPFVFNRQNQTAQTTSAIRIGITNSGTTNETSSLVSVIVLSS